MFINAEKEYLDAYSVSAEEESNKFDTKLYQLSQSTHLIDKIRQSEHTPEDLEELEEILNGLLAAHLRRKQGIQFVQFKLQNMIETFRKECL